MVKFGQGLIQQSHLFVFEYNVLTILERLRLLLIWLNNMRSSQYVYRKIPIIEVGKAAVAQYRDGSIGR